MEILAKIAAAKSRFFSEDKPEAQTPETPEATEEKELSLEEINQRLTEVNAGLNERLEVLEASYQEATQTISAYNEKMGDVFALIEGLGEQQAQFEAKVSEVEKLSSSSHIPENDNDNLSPQASTTKRSMRDAMREKAEKNEQL